VVVATTGWRNPQPVARQVARPEVLRAARVRVRVRVLALALALARALQQARQPPW